MIQNVVRIILIIGTSVFYYTIFTLLQLWFRIENVAPIGIAVVAGVLFYVGYKTAQWVWRFKRPTHREKEMLDEPSGLEDLSVKPEEASSKIGGTPIKQFVAWFFKDSIKISSQSLDEGSKRLGKLLIFLWLGGFWIFVLMMSVSKGIPDRPKEWVFMLIFGIILPWIVYRVFRGMFWVVDGFRKPKE